MINVIWLRQEIIFIITNKKSCINICVLNLKAPPETPILTFLRPLIHWDVSSISPKRICSKWNCFWQVSWVNECHTSFRSFSSHIQLEATTSKGIPTRWQQIGLLSPGVEEEENVAALSRGNQSQILFASLLDSTYEMKRWKACGGNTFSSWFVGAAATQPPTYLSYRQDERVATTTLCDSFCQNVLLLGRWVVSPKAVSTRDVFWISHIQSKCLSIPRQHLWWSVDSDALPMKRIIWNVARTLPW